MNPAPLLKPGLCQAASDSLRAAGLPAIRVVQTIGNARASAGTHAADGQDGGRPYCAAVDIRVLGWDHATVAHWLSVLADHDFAAFYREPGRDHWPKGEAPHIHAVYVGCRMKPALQAQVRDWLHGLNGLQSHVAYAFWQASSAQKNRLRCVFLTHNG